MKVAYNQHGIAVNADKDAPNSAFCPHCRGELSLRTRRSMTGRQVTYYWRHTNNANMHCNARSAPTTIFNWRRHASTSQY